MRRKNFEIEKRESTQAQAPTAYRVINLTESVMPLPYYDETGSAKTLHLRVQGRGGQVPPVIPSVAVTDRMRELVKRRLIRLEKVK